MRLVKDCCVIKYFFRKIFAVKIKDPLFEYLIMRYYKILKRKQTGINNTYHRRRKLVVSMTSIPDRVDKVWLTVESLLRQTCRPDGIILWLAEEEFKGRVLPLELKEQQKRGLRIRYCDNIRSYKKFYYTVEENPDAYVVTVDDDMIYAEDMLEKMVKTYKENPGCIICNRSHVMRKRYGKLCKYDGWTMYEDRKKIDGKPAFHNFFTGCGGTLFPMFLMDRRVLDKEVFMCLAPYADDVWLNFSAWVSNLKVVNTKGFLGYSIEVRSSSEKGLSKSNVMYHRNDKQIEQVLKYFKIDINRYL